MMLPEIMNIKTNIQEENKFLGYNRNEVIGDNEFCDMENLSGDLYPAISVRRKRGLYKELNKINGLFGKEVLSWVDGTGFYYDGVLKGEVTDSEKRITSLGAYILIFPDKKYYNTVEDVFGDMEAEFVQESTATFSNDYYTDSTLNEANLYVKIACTGIGSKFKLYDAVKIEGITNSTLEGLNKAAVIYKLEANYILIVGFDLSGKTYSQTSGLKVSRGVPSLQFVTEHDNRLWGCSSEKREVYASKLGDPFNWNAFEGISTDSYAVTIGSPGAFTGVASHLGYVLFFKEECIHKVFGTKPSNFQLNTTHCRGIESGSDKSAVILNETLYYKSPNGVVAFGGGMPESIYQAFGDEKYRNGTGSKFGDKYYIAMKNKSGKSVMFCYDQKTGMWHRESCGEVQQMVYCDGMLYYVEGNTIKKITGDDEVSVSWYGEFGETNVGLLDRNMNKLKMSCRLEDGASFDVFLKYDNDVMWEKVSTIHSTVRRVYDVPIMLKRCSRVKIKIAGTGNMVLYSISKVFTKGGMY